MWARFHPAVKNCQVLLYPIKQKMDNPYYEIPPVGVGVQKPPSRGAKIAPKLDVVTPYGSNYGEAAAKAAGDLSRNQEGKFAKAHSQDSTSGGFPLKPPGCSVNSESDFFAFEGKPAVSHKEARYIINHSDRMRYLEGLFCNHTDATIAILAEMDLEKIQRRGKK